MAAFAGAYVAASFAGRAPAELEYVRNEYARVRDGHILFLKKNIKFWVEQKKRVPKFYDYDKEIASSAKDLAHYINEKYADQRDQRRKRNLPWYKRMFD